MYRKN